MWNQKEIDEKRECPQDYGDEAKSTMSFPMTNIPITDILTIIFVLVDD